VKKDLAGKFVRGESVTFWSVTSTTFNVEVLQEEMFLGKVGDRTMFTIAAKTVRDIQHYSAMGLTESEFISLPGTSYDVQGVLDQGALKIVQLAENVAECMLDFEPDVQAYAALEAGSAVAPALSSPSTAAPAPAPAPAAAGGGAAAAGDDVEEELQELVSEMVKLKVGLKKACAAFARSLAAAGVMSLEELRPLPQAKARRVLEKSGMQELQIDKVVAAYSSSPPAPAPDPKVLFPATALPRPNFIRFAGCCRLSHQRQTRHLRSSEKRRLVSC